MASNDRQETIVLGLEEEPKPATPGRSSGWLYLLVVLGIVAGVVVLAVLADRPTPSPTESEILQAEQIRERSSLSNLEDSGPELREPQARPERRTPGRPLNELVPGFTDLLIVTHLNEQGDASYQILWGPGANAAARSSSFDNGIFDISGNYFARFESSQWNRTMLAIGDLSSESSGAVAIGADGFVWHDTEVARIAYTTELEVGRRALFTADIVRRPEDSELLVEYITDIGGARLEHWGDYGFVLQSDGEMIVLGPSGADLGRAPFQFMGRDSDGELLVSDAGTLLSAGVDLLDAAPPPWSAQVDGIVVRAVASSYRPVTALEVQESSGPAVYVVSGSDLVRLDLGPVMVHGWASGGDYLIMSRDEGRKSVLVFYSLSSDEVFELEMTDRVADVFTRRP